MCINGYKLVRAAKESGLERCRKYRRKHTKRCTVNYLQKANICTWSITYLNRNTIKILLLPNLILMFYVKISVACTFTPGMRRRSDVSFRSHIGWAVSDHAKTSSRRCNWYVNETSLFETSSRRLTVT